jgi:hypothetical protein
MEALPKPNGKSIAAMLVSKNAIDGVKGGEQDGIPGDPAEAEYTGKEACADEMMSALSANDVKAFMSALDAYLDHR